jgi:hypothetical protein
VKLNDEETEATMSTSMDELRRRAHLLPSRQIAINVLDSERACMTAMGEVVTKADAIAFAISEVERAMEQARADHAEWERQAKEHEDSLVAEAEKWRALALAKDQKCRG